MTKRQQTFVWSCLIAAIVFFLAIGGWLLKPDSPEKTPLKIELQAIITDQIGQKSNMNKERVADISVSGSPGDWNAEIFLNADKGFTMISTKQRMWQDALAVLEAVSGLDQLNDISLSWIYPVSNSQNKIEDRNVMSFRFDRTTRDQLIWANVDPSILPDIAFDYQEHPILNN